MKFAEYKYVKPNIDEIKSEFNGYINEFSNAVDVNTQNEVIRKINGLREKVETSFSLASTRYSIDTSDKFYEEANDLVDQIYNIFWIN
jgi:oligoendopeptidase F